MRRRPRAASVFFAGGTVVIALLGLWASGIASIGWVGTAAALVVATTVAIAVLVMPAILRYAGPVINSLQIPFLAAPAAEAETGIGYRLSRLVQRHPVLCLVGAAAVLLLLTAPVLDLRLGISDPGNNPESFTSRRAYDLIADGFGPGTNGPVVVGFRIDDPSAAGHVGEAPEYLATVDGVASIGPAVFNEDGTAAIVTVIPESAPQDAATVTLIHDLRSALRTEYADSGAEPLVGGSTAVFIDVGEHLSHRLPYFLGAVIALSFLLLVFVFRSILVPLKAALMNLISIGASFGVLVAIFQWGWFGGVFGVAREGPVEAFVPMMLFAVLFGLSMDYEVFLVTRIREEYDASGDNTEAVARGLSVTTRVISAAGGDHGRRLPHVRVQRPARCEGVRHRAGLRRLPGRYARAVDPCAVADAAGGTLELVAAVVAGPPDPARRPARPADKDSATPAGSDRRLAAYAGLVCCRCSDGAPESTHGRQRTRASR